MSDKEFTTLFQGFTALKAESARMLEDAMRISEATAATAGRMRAMEYCSKCECEGGKKKRG